MHVHGVVHAVDTLDALRRVRREGSATRLQSAVRRASASRWARARRLAILSLQCAWRVKNARHILACLAAERIFAARKAAEAAEAQRAEAQRAEAQRAEAAKAAKAAIDLAEGIQQGRRVLSEATSPTANGGRGHKSAPQKATPVVIGRAVRHATDAQPDGFDFDAALDLIDAASPSKLEVSPSSQNLTEAANICVQIERLQGSLHKDVAHLGRMRARMQETRAAKVVREIETQTTPRSSPPVIAKATPNGGSTGLVTPQGGVAAGDMITPQGSVIIAPDDLMSQARAAALLVSRDLPSLATPGGTTPFGRYQQASEAANSLLGRTDTAVDAAQSILAYQAAQSLLRGKQLNAPTPSKIPLPSGSTTSTRRFNVQVGTPATQAATPSVPAATPNALASSAPPVASPTKAAVRAAVLSMEPWRSHNTNAPEQALAPPEALPKPEPLSEPLQELAPESWTHISSTMAASARERAPPPRNLVMVMLLLLTSIILPAAVGWAAVGRLMISPAPVTDPLLGLRFHSPEWRALAREGEDALLRVELQQVAQARAFRSATRRRLQAELSEWTELSVSASVLARLRGPCELLGMCQPAPQEALRPASVWNAVGMAFH